MENRKWFFWTIGCALLMIVMIAACVFITDPLMMFRDGSSVFSSMHYNQRYSAPGAARFTSYDMVVTGSCMVGQFDVGEVNEVFQADALKLTYNAATFRDDKMILDVCFSNQPQIQTVLISIDAFSAIQPADKTGYPLPEYVYSRSLKNDATYLLNLDVFYHFSVKNLIGTMRGKKEGPVETEPDHPEGPYSWETVLSSFAVEDLADLEPADTAAFHANTIDNLKENLLPVIEAHPDTQFVFFLPPYSVLYWEKQLALGTFEPMMDSIRMIIEACLQYENVTIYQFMWEEETITDLDNYRDIMHYSPAIASEILEGIADGKNRVTIENYSDEMNGFIEFILTFDFENYIADYQSSKITDQQA